MLERMAISDELRRALDQTAGGPVFVVDPANGEEIVMLRAAAYEALSRDLAVTDTYVAQENALAAVWNEPELDVYNDAVPPDSQ